MTTEPSPFEVIDLGETARVRVRLRDELEFIDASTITSSAWIAMKAVVWSTMNSATLHQP